MQAIEADVPRLRVLGGAGTGKSYVVAKRVEGLLRRGCDPGQILVIVSNQNAARKLEGRLEDAGVDPAALAITAIQDLCVTILSTSEAREATGRVPRIINSMEELFLLEDLKLIGMRPGRIREILKYLYREWTELGDEKDGFIQDGWESDLLAAVQSHLIARNAMVPSELSNITYKYLQDHGQACAAFSYQHVFVDDYQNLNKASQLVVEMLAAKSLTIAGNPYQSQGYREPYPYPEGLEACLGEQGEHETGKARRGEPAEETRPDGEAGPDDKDTGSGWATAVLSESMRCPQRIVAAGNALIRAELGQGKGTSDLLVSCDARVPQGDLTVMKWDTPEAEYKGLASALKERLLREPATMKAGDILVVVPNRFWGRRFAQELDALSIEHEDIYGDNQLAGNPQRLEASSAMRTYTALMLAACPDDIVAWRAWCGFGDYLMNSNAWNQLLLYADSHKLGLIDALKEASESSENFKSSESEGMPFMQADILGQAYRSGARLLEQCKGKTGHELLAVLRQGDDATYADFERLVEPIDESHSALEIYKKASARCVDPWFQTDDRVRIASLSTAMGLEASLVVFLGLVDGFLPSSSTFGFSASAQAQDRRRKRERHAFYNILSRSQGELILSYFQRSDIETAQRLSMEIRRIRSDGEERIALLSPSQFIAEINNATPDTTAAGK